ncbi:uncharacterized protein TM35_000012700 [Trypanosoma theileri]|uniref:Uncharacterized protein n=1 Tax=Trypanosoma theileri TaxID=67003 RepID=A0A1X0P9T2_9TRYP|nr:uncharacterized protein TM35_000012700 [Trypanosoma theileri]ORC93393.1 hypothetical protein TM35_000012700 [Trypanosoma theileri]
MFRDVLGTAGRQWRAERRLATLVAATRRNPTQKWTHRISKTVLARQNMLRTKEEEGRQKRKSLTSHHNTSKNNTTNRNSIHMNTTTNTNINSRNGGNGSSSSSSSSSSSRHLTPDDVEFLRRQQEEAVAEDDARAGATGRKSTGRQTGGPTSSTSHLGYDRVDQVSGKSIIQQRFDALAYEAVLKYGPPLPAEFVAENDIVSPLMSNASSSKTSNTKDEAFSFYDEVSVKPHELFQMIRQLDPSFSIHTHADGVPFSLLLKNCLYFRVWGGRVHFMRCLHRVSPNGDGVAADLDNSETPGEITVGLAKYKMREAPSFDGLRQGPQPWLYNYRMM